MRNFEVHVSYRHVMLRANRTLRSFRLNFIFDEHRKHENYTLREEVLTTYIYITNENNPLCSTHNCDVHGRDILVKYRFVYRYMFCCVILLLLHYTYCSKLLNSIRYIKKYSSTSNLGMGKINNNRLYLRNRSSSQK